MMMTQTASPAPAPPVMAASPPAVTETEGAARQSSSHPHTQKIKHRSSKPILAWVQRKLAGGNNPSKHAKDQPSPTGLDGVASSQERQRSGSLSTSTAGHNTRQPGQPRRVSEPKKGGSSNNATGGSKPRKSAERSAASATGSNKNASMRKKAMLNHAPASLASTTGNAEAGAQVPVLSGQTHGSDSAPPSPRSTSLSFAGWSNPPEADDDASIRPLPPTSPPSPAPSKSTHHTISSYTSGGYVSDPKTFRSGAASTKPTTLLSIDVGHAVGAHIAQAPSSTGGPPSIVGAPGTAPSSPSLARFPSGGPRGHAQGPSTASITFSTLPGGTRHPLATQVAEAEGDDQNSVLEDSVPITVPNLSHYHPRNNPRPLSPPLDNASMLTLASSTMAGGPRPQGTPSIASRFPVSVTGLGHGAYDGDQDASVRALRPRSRRGSWGSVTSTETGWSAAVHALGPNARKPAEGSLRTADGPDEEDMSIHHVQIDEEEDLGASVTSEATANREQPVVPITLTSPTPETSKATTPQQERDDPAAVAVIPSTATESEAVKAEADGDQQVEVAPEDVISIAVPVAKTTAEDSQ